MMSSNVKFIPGGYEDSDSEEDDDFFDDYKYNRYERRQFNSVSIDDNQNTNDLIDFSENNQLVVNQNDNKRETNSPKLKRKALMRSSHSPSSGSLVLDDIRLGVINGNLDYFKSQIECENNFFIDTVLKAGWTSLMYASNNGHKDLVHYCLENGADPNYHKDGLTPLMTVCSSVNQNEDDLISCVQYLIKFGANVNSRDKNGNSCLIYAAKSGKCGIVSELIENNAEINDINKEKWSALHWAANEGNGKVVEKLINSNIDINLKTNLCQTAAQIALSKGYETISDVLEKVNQRNNEGINEVESNSSDKKRLSHEESELLLTYVKPNNNFEVQPKKRTHEDLEEFLRLSNVSDLFPKFEKMGICYQDLITTPEECLERIGVTDIAIKRKIISNIILIHKQEWRKESLRDLNLNTNINCPEMMSIMTNIANHITRIDHTIVFLRHKIYKSPEILSYDNDITTINKVRDETLQTLINTRYLYQELQFFRQELNKITDTSEPQTEDIMKISYTLENEILDFNNNNNNNKSQSYYSKSALIISVGVLSVFILKYGRFTKENVFDFIVKTIPKPNFSKFNFILLTM